MYEATSFFTNLFLTLLNFISFIVVQNQNESFSLVSFLGKIKEKIVEFPKISYIIHPKHFTDKL